MDERERGRKPAREPVAEYAWVGEGARPEIRWRHAARPLWAQVVPPLAAVLLAEKERLLLRGVEGGEVAWEHPARSLPDELAPDAEGLVAAFGAEIRDLDPATGRIRWRQRPGGPVTALALDPDTVYAGTRGPLFALDRDRGRQRWRAPCGWQPELHPFPEAGMLVVDDPEKESVTALRTEDGGRLWEFSAEGQPVAAGPLAAGVLAVSCHEAGLAGVDAASGEVRWRVEGEGAFEASAAVREGRLFATDGSIHAVDAATGEVAWRRDAADPDDRYFSVRAVEGDLLAETWRGRLLSLDPEDGSTRWERRPGQVHGITADARRLYLRVNPQDDERRWSVLAVDRASGDAAWELAARRMVPDVTRAGESLVVEFKTEVIVLGPL